MYCKLILSVLLLSTIALGKTDLQTQYCSLKNGTTGEIVIGVNPSAQSRDPTWFVMRTQSFASTGGVVSLSYTENQGSLSIEETDSNLTTKVHTDATDNTLVYIDSRNQYILAKQVTNELTGQFTYALFQATLGTAGTMTKFSISSKFDINSNDISKMSLKKILDVTSTSMYVLLSGSNKSSVYKVNLTSENNLEFYGALSTTQALNIIGGSYKYLYDSTTEKFYELGVTPAVSYTAKSFSDLGIDSILSSSSLGFIDLQGLDLAYSQKNGVTNILPIDLQTINSSAVVSISGTPTIFTDNYKNLVAVTPTDLVWIRVGTSGLEKVKLSATSLTQTVKTQILSIFNLAQYVSFNDNSSIVVKREPSNVKASVYSVSFDSTAVQVLTVVDEYPNSINIVDATYKSLSSPTAVSVSESSFSCNCISLSIQRVDCFASALKCIPITKINRETCNKTA